MKPLLLTLLVAGVHGILGAQEPVTLNQRFQLHYSRWQSDQNAAATTTRASYDFNLGLPVLTYRLGAIAFNGSMDYDRLSTGTESNGALGLNQYGVRATLFPYRPFHLTFDYSHAQSPGLAGLERVTGNVYGMGLNYRGRTVQDFEVSVRRGVTSQAASAEDWSLWKLVARQKIRGTQVSITATHQDFGSSEGILRWRSSNLYAATDTTLSRTWYLRTNLQADEGAGARSLSTDLSLTGTPGHWTSISSLSMSQNQGDTWGSRSAMLSESLALNGERFSAFSSAALSSIQIQGGPGGTNMGTALVGGAYSFGQGWRVSADVSQSFGGSGQGAGTAQGRSGGAASPQNLTTVHGGISQGGDLPGVIQRTLFFLSDRSFQRRVADGYPPGYVPAELATEMAQRRIRQSGNFTFAGDLWHLQAGNDEGRADWARLTGQVRLNAGLTFLVIGDWRKDEGISVPGTRTDSKAFTVNGSYRFGVSSVIANAGYSKNEQSALPGNDTPVLTAALDPSGAGSANRFLSLGFNSRFWLIPYGVQWARYEDGWQPATRSFSGYCMLNFRQIKLRISYESVRRGNGSRYNRVTVDLLRLFDTIALWGFGRR